MQIQQIIEGNKAICRLLGFEHVRDNIYRVPNLFPSNEDSGWIECGAECIGFDTDWNMLIGAHNKARKLFIHIDKSIQKEFLESDKTMVERFGFVNFFSAFENQYNIGSCWLKMVDFAKWYNSINK